MVEVFDENFDGAKAAVFIGGDLLVYQRDDIEGLPYRGLWDFPGGGREGDETPEETVLREIEEEFGLTIAPDALGWRRAFQDGANPRDRFWFFVIHLPASTAADVVFGDEGQRWALMSPADYFARPDIIPFFRPRMGVWARETGAQWL